MKKSALVICIFEYLLICLLPKPMLAASYTSFGVYPPKISVVSPPDQKVKVPLKIINGGDLETLTFSASSITTTLEGSVELNDKQEEALTWLKINTNDLSKATEKIDAGAESTINLTIEIPKNALVNDHYIALIISALNNESYPTTTTRGVAQIAIPIIISVKDTNTKEELTVTKFEIPKLSLNTEIPISLIVKNPGKYLVETVGTISSKGMFSSKHQEILPRETVLAEKERIIGGKNYTLKTHSLGITNISITIQLDKSDPLTISKSVFIIPIQILLPILVLVIAVIFTAIKSKLSRKPNSRKK